MSDKARRHGVLGIPLPIRVTDDYDPAWLAREYTLYEGYAERKRLTDRACDAPIEALEQES
jgi:hypothetical protein